MSLYLSPLIAVSILGQLVLWGAFLVGAKVSETTSLSRRQYIEIMCMLQRNAVNHERALGYLRPRWRPAPVDEQTWISSSQYPTGEYTVVPKPVYGEPAAPLPVVVGAPKRTEVIRDGAE